MNERRNGYDSEYIGALPGGPVPVPEEAVRRILNDPEGFARAVSDCLKEKRAEMEGAEEKDI